MGLKRFCNKCNIEIHILNVWNECGYCIASRRLQSLDKGVNQ